MTDKEEKKCDFPSFIQDSRHNVSYKRQAFLGKGAFGKCFELVNTNDCKAYAGKIVSKEILQKHHMKEKIVQEISIHRNLNHKHVVSFHGFFEDESYIYIILELCRKRSMAELHKRRRGLTDPEVRYYLKQILSGVEYLHSKRIAHRDLKLGNLFISQSMEVKIGDFGLSTRIEDGERKKTMCGTPNYIAPEILDKKGHGFEVDIWSIGCIIYILVVGKPPFETTSCKETYGRIRRCEYSFPANVNVNKHAQEIIRRIFVKNPKARPRVQELINCQFMQDGYTPPSLPASCLVMAPKFSITDKAVSKKRKPLTEVNIDNSRVVSKKPKTSQDVSVKLAAETCPVPTGYSYLRTLRSLLQDVLKSRPSEREQIATEEAEDPAAHPVVWISSWVDYSDKYGFAYKLNDNSIGVVFIDSTKLVLLSNGVNVQYTDRDGSEKYYTVEEYDTSLAKKMRLLAMFRQYMGHLVKTGARIPVEESDRFIRLPVLCDWMRYDRAVVMLLSNGTLQVNFFPDHSKIILCPLMGAVTFIDRCEVFHTYRLTLIKKYGCNKMLFWRLQYALKKVNEMLNDDSKAAK